ncbi:S8/S53 family peptidase [Aureisphaera galaxeae]|uniref:S8 family peptidase n=1 Tax=Aureisphaera galaxeae TaxID=1538023 RepID=UPI002350F806|nr:S8/S53 family peptidase [Aureisphaera galaxeae]MDC8004467.1 S8/S53 family peptidase [Aureisphaera galaxeae]
MRQLLFLLSLVCFVSLGYGQQDTEWFYFRAKDSVTIPFQKKNNRVEYAGQDAKLKALFSKYEIYQFKKTQKWATKENLYKTYFARTNSKAFLNDVLENAAHVFISGEIVDEEDKKIYEPNDYGLTSTIGENLGLPVNMDYLDFLGLPKAWYYTTGSKDVVIGVADGAVNIDNADFKGKINVIGKTIDVKSHGDAVASYVAGQGDNAEGVTGVCYDCSMTSTGFNFFNVRELNTPGLRVINCSWSRRSYVEKDKQSVADFFKRGILIVGTSGNVGWDKHKDKLLRYPGAYDHAISVSTAMYKYPDVLDNIKVDAKGNYYAENIRGFVGRTVGFKDNDTTQTYRIWPSSTTNMNDAVDILAPSVGMFKVSQYSIDKSIEYIGDEATSPAAPLVSGTIALMFSLYPCLPVDEVEGILKMTAWNVDHIKANKPYLGKFGAGMLQTGDAVEMVYQLYNEKETAYIKDQDFSRWDFKLTALSKELRIQDQKFREAATLNVKAKNRIVIGANTHLKPNTEGSIRLTIDPTLEKECDLVLRDPSILED